MKIQSHLIRLIINDETHGNVGFFSYFLKVIGGLKIAEMNSVNVVVNFDNKGFCYWEDAVLFGTTNAWEWYFNQPFVGWDVGRVKNAQKEEKYKVYETGEYPHGQFIYHDDEPYYEIELANYLVKKYIKIKPWIQDEIDDFYKNKFSKQRILGVHIRGTDSYKDFNLPNISIWIRKIESMLEKKWFDKVFLATDEERTVKIMKENFGDKLLFTNCTRTPNNVYNPVMYLTDEELKKICKHPNPRYKIGEEALIDCLLLSKSDTLLCGYSNMITAARYFNKDLTVIRCV